MGKQNASLVSWGMTLSTEIQQSKKLSMKGPETLRGEKRPTEKQREVFLQEKTGHLVNLLFRQPCLWFSWQLCAQVGLWIWASEAKSIEMGKCPGPLILGAPFSSLIRALHKTVLRTTLCVFDAGGTKMGVDNKERSPRPWIAPIRLKRSLGASVPSECDFNKTKGWDLKACTTSNLGWTRYWARRESVHQFPSSPPSGTGGHSVMNTTCHPFSCPPGPGWIWVWAGSRFIARPACNSTVSKRQEGQPWDFPAPR